MRSGPISTAAPAIAAGPKKEPKKPYAARVTWYDPKDEVPNSTEILFFAFLVATLGRATSELREWAAAVRLQRATYLSRGAAALPPAYQKIKGSKKMPAILEPLVTAYEGSWKDARLAAIGNAMQMLTHSCPGRADNLTFWRLKTHRTKLKGLWRAKTYEALFGVAEHLWARGGEMQQRLGDFGDEPMEQLPTSVDIIALMSVDL